MIWNCNYKGRCHSDSLHIPAFNKVYFHLNELVKLMVVDGTCHFLLRICHSDSPHVPACNFILIASNKYVCVLQQLHQNIAVAKASDGARGTTRTRNGKQRTLKLSPMSLSKHVNISSQDGGIFIPCLSSCGLSYKEQSFLIEHKSSKTCFISVEWFTYYSHCTCNMQHANAVIEWNQLQDCMT